MTHLALATRRTLGSIGVPIAAKLAELTSTRQQIVEYTVEKVSRVVVKCRQRIIGR